MRELIEKMEGLSGCCEYRDLNDASEVISGLGKGSTEIWYMKPGMSRDLGMGSSFLIKKNKLPDPKNLKKTHILLGKVKMKDPDDIYSALQSENWSQRGEARAVIKGKGLAHTSMSIGDVIVSGGKPLMVDGFGKYAFYDLNK